MTFFLVWEVHWSAWFQENSWKSWECMAFLLSLRSALECVIWGKFLKSLECAGSVWFLQLSLRSALGVRDFRKMLEVLGVRWKCIAHFCYGGGSALGVRESALECVTNDRSAWKVCTPTHFCSARGLMFSMANQWEVTKTRFFLISTIIADIWTKVCLHIVITQ